jgi:hypothetical protein
MASFERGALALDCAAAVDPAIRRRHANPMMQTKQDFLGSHKTILDKFMADSPSTGFEIRFLERALPGKRLDWNNQALRRQTTRERYSYRHVRFPRS